MSQAQRVVQASHAAIEMGRNLIFKGERHPNLVVIGIKNESKLRKVLQEIASHTQCCSFIEEDGSLTSFITKPVVDKEKFQRFSLLR